MKEGLLAAPLPKGETILMQKMVSSAEDKLWARDTRVVLNNSVQRSAYCYSQHPGLEGDCAT